MRCCNLKQGNNRGSSCQRLLTPAHSLAVVAAKRYFFISHTASKSIPCILELPSTRDFGLPKSTKSWTNLSPSSSPRRLKPFHQLCMDSWPRMILQEPSQRASRWCSYATSFGGEDLPALKFRFIDLLALQPTELFLDLQFQEQRNRDMLSASTRPWKARFRIFRTRNRVVQQ